jgi:hypothetical protein
MNPPAAVPNITGADTESQLSVALGANFQSSRIPSSVIFTRLISMDFAAQGR